MKSFFSSRISKFNLLITLGVFGITTLSTPVTATPQEVCVMTSAGNVACGKPVPKPSNQTDNNNTIDSQVLGDLTLDLKSCTRGVRNTINCILSLHANRDIKPVYLYLSSNTKLVDSSGNEYHADKVQVGNRMVGNNVSFSIAQGANYKVIFNFIDVPTSVSQMVLLQLSVGGVVCCYDSYYVKFRNIPIY